MAFVLEETHVSLRIGTGGGYDVGMFNRVQRLCIIALDPDGVEISLGSQLRFTVHSSIPAECGTRQGKVTGADPYNSGALVVTVNEIVQHPETGKQCHIIRNYANVRKFGGGWGTGDRWGAEEGGAENAAN
jgi:hypothetical protein